MSPLPSLTARFSTRTDPSRLFSRNSPITISISWYGPFEDRDRRQFQIFYPDGSVSTCGSNRCQLNASPDQLETGTYVLRAVVNETTISETQIEVIDLAVDQRPVRYQGQANGNYPIWPDYWTAFDLPQGYCIQYTKTRFGGELQTNEARISGDFVLFRSSGVQYMRSLETVRYENRSHGRADSFFVYAHLCRK